MTVNEAIKDAGSGWLANGCSNGGDGGLRRILRIHTFIVDKLLMFGQGIFAPESFPSLLGE